MIAYPIGQRLQGLQQQMDALCFNDLSDKANPDRIEGRFAIILIQP